MDQVNEKFKNRVEELGGNKAAIARTLGGNISGQLIGQYIAGRQTPKEPFFKKWFKAYGEDIRSMFPKLEEDETNVSRDTVSVGNKNYSAATQDIGEDKKAVLPLGNLKVTLEDYVNEIKRQRDYLEHLVVAKSDKIIELLVNSGVSGEASSSSRGKGKS